MSAWNPAPGEVNCNRLRWGNQYSFYIFYMPADLDVDKII